MESRNDTEAKPTRLLNLEKELAGETDIPPQQALGKYDNCLIALANRLKQALDAGLPPDDFAKCNQLAEAVTTARKILRLALKN